eukprot:6177048-Pleurochrysis_carterae.AAC.8
MSHAAAMAWASATVPTTGSGWTAPSDSAPFRPARSIASGAAGWGRGHDSLLLQITVSKSTSAEVICS